MQYQAQRAYLLDHFQEYRIIQPTVIFLHGLPTALSRKNTLENELQLIGRTLRINLQTAGKDFFTAFVEFDAQIPAALAIISLDGRQLMNRSLRVFYGSTKFCPHYLKGHTCRLQDCNYAHYFHSTLTYLKDQAKDIDHRTIAAMFLSQDATSTQIALASMVQAITSRKLILPIDGGYLMRQFAVNQAANGTAVQNEGEIRHQGEASEESKKAVDEKQVVQEQWGILSDQISKELTLSSQSSQRTKRTRIQEFLDGAQRFLTKLIFQSSGFII